MMRDDVVINNVEIMDAVFVAGVMTGYRVVVAKQGRRNLYYFYTYENLKMIIKNDKENVSLRYKENVSMRQCIYFINENLLEIKIFHTC